MTEMLKKSILLYIYFFNFLINISYDTEVKMLGKLSNHQIKIECFLDIEVKQSKIFRKTKVFAIVEFINKSDCDVLALKSRLLLERKLTNDFFVIIYNGLKVPYTGMMIKMIPTLKDYYLFKKGEKIRRKVEISKYYNLSRKVKYIVYYDAMMIKDIVYETISNKVEFEIK